MSFPLTRCVSARAAYGGALRVYLYDRLGRRLRLREGGRDNRRGTKSPPTRQSITPSDADLDLMFIGHEWVGRFCWPLRVPARDVLPSFSSQGCIHCMQMEV